MGPLAFVVAQPLVDRILKQYFDDLAQVAIQLIERFTLAARVGEVGHITNIKLCVGTLLNEGGVSTH